MTSELQWYVEGRVLYLRLSGVVSTEEGRQNNQRAIEMIDAGQPPVYTILHDQDLQKVEASLAEMTRTLEVYRHPSLKWIVAVGDSSASTRFLTSILSRLFRVSFHRCNTLEQAVDFLRAKDPTIDWTKADPALAVRAPDGG